MGSITCKHNDPDHISHSIGDTVWMKCDCGEEWTGLVPWWVSANLCRGDEELEAEIARLKRGDFTVDEFQNLCHNLPETCTREDFEAGCKAYQEKLFGKP